jgi:hypothetical protein
VSERSHRRRAWRRPVGFSEFAFSKVSVLSISAPSFETGYSPSSDTRNKYTVVISKTPIVSTLLVPVYKGITLFEETL